MPIPEKQKRAILDEYLATKEGRTKIFKAVQISLATHSGFLLRPEEYYRWDDNDLREQLTKIIWAHQDMMAQKFKELTEEVFWAAVEDLNKGDLAQAIDAVNTAPLNRNHPFFKDIAWTGPTLRERIVAAQAEWEEAQGG